MKVVVVGTGSGNARMLGGDGVPEVKYPIKAKPDISGPHGKAWRCNLDAGRATLGANAGDDATLAHWIVEAPWAHPIWHSYSIILVHLRPVPSAKKTLFYLDGATHEIWIYALNPDADLNPAIESGVMSGKTFLSPLNFASQFIEVEDRLALDRVGAAVQAICDQKLSPDTDYRSDWIALFGDNMMKDRPNHRPPVEV